MNKKPMTRREFLKKGSLGALFLLGGGLNSLGSSASLLNTFLKQPAGLRPATLLPQMGDMFMPDAEVLITASEKFVQILPGAQTRVWGYEGELISGSGVTVQSIPGSYLGPILRVRKGTKLRLIFQNDLAEDSVIHPHGLRVPEDCDGQPMQAVGPGGVKVYDFEVIDRLCPAPLLAHMTYRWCYRIACSTQTISSYINRTICGATWEIKSW